MINITDALKKAAGLFYREKTEKVRLGDAQYQVVHLSDLLKNDFNDKAHLPVLAKVGDHFFQINEPTLGYPEITIRHMLEQATRTSLPQICELNQKSVVVVGPGSSLEEGLEMARERIPSARAAAFQYKEQAQLQRSATGASIRGLGPSGFNS